MSCSKIKTVLRSIKEGNVTVESIARNTGISEVEIRKMIENGWIDAEVVL